MVSQPRVAVLGGDGRFRPEKLPGCRVRLYRGCRYGGNGELRRLEQALKAGTIDRLIVLARWNSHSVTSRALRLCRRLQIPVQIQP